MSGCLIIQTIYNFGIKLRTSKTTLRGKNTNSNTVVDEISIKRFPTQMKWFFWGFEQFRVKINPVTLVNVVNVPFKRNLCYYLAAIQIKDNLKLNWLKIELWQKVILVKFSNCLKYKTVIWKRVVLHELIEEKRKYTQILENIHKLSLYVNSLKQSRKSGGLQAVQSG